jgi:hypothetical protein
MAGQAIRAKADIDSHFPPTTQPWGVEPATGADEQEEKRDFRSASARGRAAKADGVIAEAQAGDSPR